MDNDSFYHESFWLRPGPMMIRAALGHDRTTDRVSPSLQLWRRTLRSLEDQGHVK